MIFHQTELPGAFVIEPELRKDERGLFATIWSADEWRARGLNPKVVLASVSFNNRRGTLRGMHYQLPPYEEAKLVRCTRGALVDVIIDLRRDSPAFKRHLQVELTAENRKMLYVPEGCAHGFLTLHDNTQVDYQISQAWAPDYARGVRWNDPVFGIHWPAEPLVIADRDRNYPDFAG